MKKITIFLNSLKKKLAYGERIRPVRDWFLLLGVAVALLAVSVCWNIFLFNQFENAKNITNTAPANPQNGVGNSISQVQSIFQQRAMEEGNYQKLYHFVDPSQPGA